MTTDADGAQRFCADVVGWRISPSVTEGVGDYRTLSAPDGAGVGGLMTLSSGAPLKPGWLCYIGVQDVDGAAEKTKSLGERAKSCNLRRLSKLGTFAPQQCR